MFKIVTPDVDKYLLREAVKPEISEQHTHNNGSTHIERVLRTIQDLMRFAMMYILKCCHDVYIFLWLINLVNLKPYVHVPSKAKYEVYHNEKPYL